MNAGSAGTQTQAGNTFPLAVNSHQAGNTSSQACSTSLWPGRNAGNAGVQSQAGSTSPRQLVLVHPRQVAPLPSWKATQVVWVLNHRLPALLSSNLMLVLPRQASHRSPRHSPPQRGENTLEDPKLKWVINLSSKPLTQAQRVLTG